MKHFILGKEDIPFVWVFNTHTGLDFPLSLYPNRKVYYSRGTGQTEVENIQREGNMLTWTLKAKDQKFFGQYSVKLEIYNEDGVLIRELIHNNAFALQRCGNESVNYSRQSELNGGDVVELHTTIYISKQEYNKDDVDSLFKSTMDAVNAEKSRAESAEESLRQSVATTDGKLTQEINRAKGAEQTLADDIAAEKKRAMNTEEGLHSNIQDEQSRAEEAEYTLSQVIHQEEQRATDAERGLHSLINEEKQRATAAEGMISGEVNSIKDKIPSLATKDFVNSSIATATATFRGTYTDMADFPRTGCDLNDYVFLKRVDAHGNVVSYERYKWGKAGVWLFEYALNNSSFTDAQWKAINSGFTDADKRRLSGISRGSEAGYSDITFIDGRAPWPTIDDHRDSIVELEYYKQDKLSKEQLAKIDSAIDRSIAAGIATTEIENECMDGGIIDGAIKAGRVVLRLELDEDDNLVNAKEIYEQIEGAPEGASFVIDMNGMAYAFPSLEFIANDSGVSRYVFYFPGVNATSALVVSFDGSEYSGAAASVFEYASKEYVDDRHVVLVPELGEEVDDTITILNAADLYNKIKNAPKNASIYADFEGVQFVASVRATSSDCYQILFLQGEGLGVMDIHPYRGSYEFIYFAKAEDLEGKADKSYVDDRHVVLNIELGEEEETQTFGKARPILNAEQILKQIQAAPNGASFYIYDAKSGITTEAAAKQPFVSEGNWILYTSIEGTISLYVLFAEGTQYYGYCKTGLLEYADNKVQSISDPGSEDEYPSTKAVVDYAQQKLSEEQLTNINIVPTKQDKTFVAVYNKTTYNEIKEAYEAGREVICRYGNRNYQLTVLTSERAVFNVLAETTSNHTIICQNNSSWRYIGTSLENRANRQSVITESDTNYPSSKAVVDYVNGNAASKSEVQELRNTVNLKAFADGYYAQMRVGLADNLTPRGESVDAEFKERIAGGGMSITDGSAKYEEIRGNSPVWNQHVKNGNFTQGLSDWTFVNSTGTTDNGILKVVKYEGLSNNVGYVWQSYNYVIGHTYMFYCEAMCVDNSFQLRIGANDALFTRVLTPVANTWTPIIILRSVDVQPTRPNILWITTDTQDGSSLEAWFRNVHLIDLTQMFGAGNEPTTYEEFLRRKPTIADEYAYNEGEIISNKVEGIKTTDADGNEIGKLDLSWIKGIKDEGGVALFEDGLRGVGSVFDVVTETKAIKRIGADGAVLAEPIEVNYEEKNMTIPVAAGGMEIAIAETPSSPLKAKIVYGMDAYQQIVANKNNIGNPATLATTAKELVGAINELKAEIERLKNQ